MNNIPITIINDCRDQNARARQEIRIAGLFGTIPIFIGVQNDIEASGNIVDALDALRGHPGIIIANVAPRDGNKAHKNGSPFCYFTIGETTIVSTVQGYTLSLLKKLGLLPEVRVIDIKSSLVSLGTAPEEMERIANSQFRSMEFLPLIAFHVFKKESIPSKIFPIESIPDMPRTIWWADNFGNCKTTLLREELEADPDDSVSLLGKTIPLYHALSAVPPGKLAATTGSSGYGLRRFIEITIGGKSAADTLRIQTGTSTI